MTSAQTGDPSPTARVTPGSQRPGGRTARTRQAVAAAVGRLIDEGRMVSFGDVAARSAVNVTTLYRRWPTPDALVIDVLHGEVEPDSAQVAGPDLRSDLTACATRLAETLMTARGVAYIGALTQATADPRVPSSVTAPRVEHRLTGYAEILARWPAARLTPRDLLDGLFAPLSLHAMLGTPFVADGSDVAQYVDNLIRLSESRLAAESSTA